MNCSLPCGCGKCETQTFYIYYHYEGYAFDAEWDDVEKTTLKAIDFEDANSKFKQLFPRATIMSIDNKD